jgi:3-oxosteroid 1-dehydrogenase
VSDGTDSGFEHEVDFLIVGSGAGAMTAGIVAADAGARVLLIEKGVYYGGSSAMSGGGLWVPNNHLMEQAGQCDTAEEALEYMKGTVGEIVPEEKMRAYLENAPAMAKYLADNTRLRFHAIPDYADYYPHVRGAKEGARCIEADAYHAREIGNREFLRMRETAVQELIMGRVSMTVPEAQFLLCRAPGWVGCIVRLMLAYALDLPWRFRSRRDRRLAIGNALVGRLRRSLMDRDVPLWLETPARRLLLEKGRVVWVEAERGGRRLRIRAERGVLLAAGGFEANQAMREAYLPQPTRTDWTCANPDNQGDAIEMGQEIGAAVDLMDDAWWGPTIVVPSEDRARMLVIEKSLPGGIMVNRAGRRFVKETAAYIDVVNVMYDKAPDSTPNLPAYLIFDATYRKKYPLRPPAPRLPATRLGGAGSAAPGFREEGEDPGRSGASAGDRRDGSARDDRSLQRAGAQRRRPRLPSRRDRLRPLLRRSRRGAQPLHRDHRGRALLRDGGLPRRARNQGWIEDRCARARPRRRRRAHRRALRYGKLLCLGDGTHLSGAGLHPGPRHDIRLSAYPIGSATSR